MCGKRNQVGEVSDQRRCQKKVVWKGSQVGEVRDQGRWQRKVGWKTEPMVKPVNKGGDKKVVWKAKPSG